ncbi:MAG: 30S ribosomal protein S20 [Phycisphaerae bacterium]
MAHSLHRKKRIRQNEKRRLRNQMRKSALKTKIRKVTEAVLHGTHEQGVETLREASKLIDRAANVGTLHRNTAARRKSKLARRVNAMAKAKS